MKVLGGSTRPRRFSCLARRSWHRPRSVSLVLLGTIDWQISGVVGMERASGRGAGRTRRFLEQTQTTKSVPPHALSPTDRELQAPRLRELLGLPQWLLSPATR